MFVVMLMFVVMFSGAFGKSDARRGIHGFPALEQVVHEILQPGPGDHDQLSAFHGLHLTDIQGIVVETRHVFRDQTGHGDAGVLRDPAGIFINRQGGGGHLGGFPGGTAAEQRAENQNIYQNHIYPK